jgi:hypothetical protein
MMMMIRFVTATAPPFNRRGMMLNVVRRQLGVVQTKTLSSRNVVVSGQSTTKLAVWCCRLAQQQQRGFSGAGRPPMPRVLPPTSPPPPGAAAVPPPPGAAAAAVPFKVQASTAGTGHIGESVPGFYARTKDRTPVSWTSLFVVGVVAASAVTYYRIERERRLERAMGKVVSSESDGSGWTPRPDFLAKRKFVPTKWGWFPVEDGFGARELLL